MTKLEDTILERINKSPCTLSELHAAVPKDSGMRNVRVTVLKLARHGKVEVEDNKFMLRKNAEGGGKYAKDTDRTQ